VRLRFGTDGVRGDTRTVLSAQAVAALGRAAAEILGDNAFAIGRDTRVSGAALVGAMHAGVAAAGGSSVDLGIITTPGVARWCCDHQVGGAVVSASHNPWHDNGVKFFAAGGSKLTETSQQEIQRRFDRYLTAGDTSRGLAEECQKSVIDRHSQALSNHCQALIGSIDGRTFAGLKIVIDLANGAATTIAKRVFAALDADLTVIHDSPDGYNINAGCGSTDLKSLQVAVVENSADVGLAFDGDADRVLAVDANGKLVDGDGIIAICALDRHQRAMLRANTVVVTTMTNLGFRLAMDAAGIKVVETEVGDRYVLETLNANGLELGGEQSGHVIFRDLATTGDGLLTAVQLIGVMVRRSSSLAALASNAMTALPQVLTNVAVPKLLSQNETVALRQLCAPLVDAAGARLAGKGRVLIRPSGTEPLIRVMVEAETMTEAQMEADALAEAVKLFAEGSLAASNQRSELAD